MQSTRSLNPGITRRRARRPREITRPLTHTWPDNPHGAAWMKAQALQYLRWRLHLKAKRCEDGQGVVWCGYLAVFLAWCLFTLLVPHLAVLSPRYGLAPDIVTRVLLACLAPTLLCMAVLNASSILTASRAARLHSELSLTDTIQTLACWLEDGWERHEILRALTELLPHVGAEDPRPAPNKNPNEDVSANLNHAGNAGHGPIRRAVHAGARGTALSARTRTLLLQSLRRECDREPAYAVAVLRGLEQWGDRDAVAVVARVARRSVQPAVAHAAQECLTVLHERFEQHRAQSVLLRPSKDTSDVLLRSVHIRAEDEAAHLLRVHTGTKPQ